jgi:hypothetical protein
MSSGAVRFTDPCGERPGACSLRLLLPSPAVDRLQLQPCSGAGGSTGLIGQHPCRERPRCVHFLMRFCPSWPAVDSDARVRSYRIQEGAALPRAVPPLCNSALCVPIAYGVCHAGLCAAFTPASHRHRVTNRLRGVDCRVLDLARHGDRCCLWDSTQWRGLIDGHDTLRLCARGCLRRPRICLCLRYAPYCCN